MVETIRPTSFARDAGLNAWRANLLSNADGQTQSEDGGTNDRGSAAAGSTVYFERLASAPFMAQLAALYLGNAHAGERRVARDPDAVRARADRSYRAASRMTSTIEAGFFGEVSY
jgi:hypothetical protein